MVCQCLANVKNLTKSVVGLMINLLRRSAMERVAWNHGMDVQRFLEHMNKAAATWLDNVHDAAVKHGCINALH